jgi:hypothetical protein
MGSKLMQLIKQFYEFIIERESIRQRRLAGVSPDQWTDDPIFKEYSFTNVKRHHDRTTTLLKREFYDVYPCQIVTDKRVLLLNAAIYRYFGTIETARVIGWTPSWSEEFRSRIYDRGCLGDLRFTPAYIVPSAGRSDPKFMVVLEIIDGIWDRAEEIVACSRWEDACGILRECFGVGSFMAKEVYLDYVLASGSTPEDWQTWTPVGPGGKRGASCIQYGDVLRISESEALDIIRAVFERRNEFWPREYAITSQLTTTMPELDLTDIQFQCCEFDKYNRVVRGDGKPKRKFRPTVDDVTKIS